MWKNSPRRRGGVADKETQLSTRFDTAVNNGIGQRQRNGKGTFFGISPTLLSTDHKGPHLVIEKKGERQINADIEIKVIGTLDKGGTTQQHNNRVHDPDGISPTLTAVAGGTYHIKIFDPTRYRVRKLTPNEYGRLQAFPVDDGWEQVVSDSQAYKQFGNAVTVNVVTAIGGAIKATLDAGAETTQNGKAKTKKEKEFYKWQDQRKQKQKLQCRNLQS